MKLGTVSIKNCYKTMTNAEHIRLSLNGTDNEKQVVDFFTGFQIARLMQGCGKVNARLA